MSATPKAIGTYIYCITPAQSFEANSPPLHTQPIGNPDTPVRTVGFEDLVAVVSDATQSRYDVSRENATAHEQAVQEVMERGVVLPLSFGTIARNDQDVVERLLKPEFDELHQQLERVQGRAEVNLKVFWRQERLFAEILAENEPVRDMVEVVTAGEASYDDRIELGQLTDEVIARKREQEAESLLDTLRPLATEVKLNPILSDMMVLNAAFLVESSRVNDFDAQVRKLEEQQAGRTIFRYVGPVPPYNFVDLKVHLGKEAHGIT